ncbi:MAG: polysaccharide deacetylase family protein [Bacteroidales bacterium]|nr:polysaccharide deacetylase family protein [Bacteroidales bacterium]
MRSICFYFQVHQPFRLRNYRFFEIGKNHNYYDDYQNRYILRRVADKCYLPMNKLLLDLINEFGYRFKVSFSISGVALEQFSKYAPEVIDSFKELANTGCVEFLAETYAHSLASLKNEEEFVTQVRRQQQLLNDLIGYKSTAFRNTELIYSNDIGDMVYRMGFDTMLTEGAKHVLGWKSPNYLYCSAQNPKLKLLLKNFRLSDDIAFRFSQRSWEGWPLTAEKYVDWLNQIDHKEEVVNLFMDYETFGEHQWPETGIFDFMRALPRTVFANSNFSFVTPTEVANSLQPIASVHVPYPISWADEERDLTAWLGNDLQDDAFDTLYSLYEKINSITSYVKNLESISIENNYPQNINVKELNSLIDDWQKLQTSDHFYYMCTKWFADGDVHKYFNPYGTPYDAYINYMNVISDFILRLSKYSFFNKTKAASEVETVKITAEKATPKKKATTAKKTTTTTKKKTAATTKEATTASKKTTAATKEKTTTTKKKVASTKAATAATTAPKKTTAATKEKSAAATKEKTTTAKKKATTTNKKSASAEKGKK